MTFISSIMFVLIIEFSPQSRIDPGNSFARDKYPWANKVQNNIIYPNNLPNILPELIEKYNRLNVSMQNLSIFITFWFS